MKRIQLLILTMICTLAAQAQLNGDGYYRVKSAKQGRYARVLDNRGSINYQTTDADLGALCTQRSWDIVVSDPGSIIYFQKIKEPNGYDFQSQGTGSYKIIQYAVQVEDMGDNKYWCSASNSLATKYLADDIYPEWADEEAKERGKLVTNVNPNTQSEYLDWDVIPVTTGDNYFGLAPTRFTSRKSPVVFLPLPPSSSRVLLRRLKTTS